MHGPVRIECRSRSRSIQSARCGDGAVLRWEGQRGALMAFFLRGMRAATCRRLPAPIGLMGGVRTAAPMQMNVRWLHQTAADDGLVVGPPSAPMRVAGERTAAKPTSAAHPRRGRGPSERPRNRFKPSEWWRGSRVDRQSGALSVEGDFAVSCLGPLLTESDEAWEEAWEELDLSKAVGVAHVLHDSDEGDFPIRAGDVVVVSSKLNPVGSLGRSGFLPEAWPPKRKNLRRRMIARELQRQRDGRRRARETAAANMRRTARHAARAQVGSEMLRRKRDGELPVSRVLLVEERLKQTYGQDKELDAWLSEVFGQEAYRPPPGRAVGVSLVH